MESFFSSDYWTARERFRQSAHAIGADLESHSLSVQGPGEQELSIDVAIWEPSAAGKTILLSSGMHGVEGYFGSAVQWALLERIRRGEVSLGNVRLVLVHALNPYGFAWGRRTNEQNVDLNRNWLLPGETYRGAPPFYGQIYRWIHPAGRPGRMDFTWWRIVWAAVRWGRRALLENLPVGQYEFPQGLFFGGQGPTETHQIVREQLRRWVGRAAEVIHVDWHTGLGGWGRGKLLLDNQADSPEAQWFLERFGPQEVSAGDPGSKKIYMTRGAWGPWCQTQLADRQYRFATAEFGTYGMARTLTALVRENRAALAWTNEDRRLRSFRTELHEVFSPNHPGWRRRVLEQAMKICHLLLG